MAKEQRRKEKYLLTAKRKMEVYGRVEIVIIKRKAIAAMKKRR